jgi:hypothetical protein
MSGEQDLKRGGHGLCESTIPTLARIRTTKNSILCNTINVVYSCRKYIETYFITIRCNMCIFN